MTDRGLPTGAFLTDTAYVRRHDNDPYAWTYQSRAAYGQILDNDYVEFEHPLGHYHS